MTTPFTTTLVVPLETYSKLRRASKSGHHVKPTPSWSAVRIIHLTTVGVFFHRSPKVIVYLETLP